MGTNVRRSFEHKDPTLGSAGTIVAGSLWNKTKYSGIIHNVKDGDIGRSTSCWWVGVVVGERTRAANTCSQPLVLRGSFVADRPFPVVRAATFPRVCDLLRVAASQQRPNVFRYKCAARARYRKSERGARSRLRVCTYSLHSLKCP
jgi:hypothetical protein